MNRTGNPFVDTGLYTIAAIMEKKSVNELTINDCREAIKKVDLVNYSKTAKSFTMIFGTNGPLYQYSFRPYNKEIYLGYLNMLLDEADKDDEEGYICEICGKVHKFDINNVWGDIITKYGFKVKERKYIGRDFFPLIGSIGNDAQALPSASRTVSICSLCLYSVNFIPVGTMLIRGRLVCIESTLETIALDLIKQIVYENKLRVSGGNKEIYGKSEGNGEIYNKLLTMFDELRRTRKRAKLPKTVALYIWLFSNSGTGPDCDMIEIPNKALQFIWEMARKPEGLKNELLNLISSNKKSMLFECITYGTDFEGLYPKGKYKGVSRALYEYYQIYVVGRKMEALDYARRIAIKILQDKTEKEIKKLRKSDLFLDRSNVALAKKIIVNMILEGNTCYEDYLNLFSIEGKYLEIDEWKALNIIMYYLYHYNEEVIREEDEIMQLEVESKKTDNKIKAFAKLYFQYYVLDKEKGLGRGIDRFYKDIISRFKTFDEIWLRQNFAKLADVYECKDLDLSYDGWEDFTHDEDGNRRVYELMFQLRLALASLYKQYYSKEVSE